MVGSLKKNFIVALDFKLLIMNIKEPLFKLIKFSLNLKKAPKNTITLVSISTYYSRCLQLLEKTS
jgi:hypothetical protein